MKPSDTIYFTRVSLPAHLRALRGQLDGGGAQAPPETLGPVTALEELLAVAEAAVEGPGPPQSDADRVSLREDVFTSFQALGPALNAHLGAAWRAFANDVSQLPRSLPRPEQARVVRGGARVLRGVLLGNGAAEAAWDDVVAAFETNEDAEMCELRLLQLREVVEARGQEWSLLVRRLTGLLNDDPHELPDVDPSSYDDSHPDLPLANVPLPDRLRRAREQVGAPAQSGDLIVWVAFQHAWLDGMYVRLGPVEFFAHQLWPDSIRAGNFTPEGVGPPELEDDYSRALRGLPNDNFVLARVQLGEGHLTRARDRARQLALDLVRTARPNSEWELMDGAATHLPSRGWNWNEFKDPGLHESAARDNPRFEPTSLELDRLDQGFADALASGDATALDAVECALWARGYATSLSQCCRFTPDVGPTQGTSRTSARTVRSRTSSHPPRDACPSTSTATAPCSCCHALRKKWRRAR